MERPALQRLLKDVEAARIDCIVVYKVDRLSRSILDFARLMEVLERQRVSFVSVTQQFNTTTSMGRLPPEERLMAKLVKCGACHAATEKELRDLPRVPGRRHQRS